MANTGVGGSLSHREGLFLAGVGLWWNPDGGTLGRAECVHGCVQPAHGSYFHWAGGPVVLLPLGSPVLTWVAPREGPQEVLPRGEEQGQEQEGGPVVRPKEEVDMGGGV